jgi:hypothetical protein
MLFEVENETVSVRMTHAEAKRLGLALREYLALSQAEYFIRSGLSQTEVAQVADLLIEVDELPFGSRSLLLSDGVAAIENPRRPRPKT